MKELMVPKPNKTLDQRSIGRTTQTYAAVLGNREDISLAGFEYSWAAALVYKLLINRFVASTLLFQGAVIMCHAVANGFTALGASINPGTNLAFSLYCSHKEGRGTSPRTSRHLETCISGGPLGSPLGTKSLTQREKAPVIVRIEHNNTSAESKQFKWSQFRKAATDLKTWLLFDCAVARYTPNGRLRMISRQVISAVLKPRPQGNGLFDAPTYAHLHAVGSYVGHSVTVKILFTPTYYGLFALDHTTADITIILICLAPFLVGVLRLRLIEQSSPRLPLDIVRKHGVLHVTHVRYCRPQCRQHLGRYFSVHEAS
ncbi:putative transporter C417.10-like protein 8 [Colletotrichum chlorophyti]|uniref:Putative transporter C417.10-like protein 8 n=1 Tax=Colletotrichum chlorophyti TaxID=708187 RepID=A0A1Q8RMG9_9PEZI|nr:putative transporter C417.10-like protein 8 [Colletotrichum chlorophyti]